MIPAIQDIFACKGIEKRFFGVPVLQDVSFRLGQGQTLGLVGENGAGKSTLMNILGGNVRPDAGGMRLAGAPYHPAGPADAARQGVAFIHQELNLFANLSVAENLFLTRLPRRASPFWPWIQRRALHQRASALLELVSLSVAPDTPVEALSAGERQLVEIARAVGSGARLIIFDEPTTSLTMRESERLFALMGRLRDQGASMIYISHQLHDVLRLADDVIVLRNGEVVGQGPRSDFSIESMIRLMVGRTLSQLYPRRQGRRQERAVLEALHLSQPGMVRDLSICLRAGEVAGVFGLMGSGRSEFARMLFGLDPFAQGTLRLGGVPLAQPTPARCVGQGMAFLTEDRRGDGLCPEATLAENLALVALRGYAANGWGWVDRPRLTADLDEMRRAVCLPDSTPSELAVRRLSGGNQQKVVLGKWLLARPQVLILDEPTRGIDVGAKHDIYGLIHALADAGTGILMISSEWEELMGVCDRILVMRRGEWVDELEREVFDRERILSSALGGARADAQARLRPAEGRTASADGESRP